MSSLPHNEMQDRSRPLEGAQPPDAYACLKRPEITMGDYAIRSIQPQDIEDIRVWRNAQIDVLRQDHIITPEMQAAYFESQIWPTFQEARPKQILVTLLQNGTRIGYGGLVHMAWPHRRAEVSFLVDPVIAADDERYGQAFDAFITLIKELAFVDLRLNRLTTETYASRVKHIALYAAQGFVEEGRLRQHVQINGTNLDCLLHACLASDR